MHILTIVCSNVFVLLICTFPNNRNILWLRSTRKLNVPIVHNECTIYLNYMKLYWKKILDRKCYNASPWKADSIMCVVSDFCSTLFITVGVYALFCYLFTLTHSFVHFHFNYRKKLSIVLRLKTIWGIWGILHPPCTTHVIYWKGLNKRTRAYSWKINDIKCNSLYQKKKKKYHSFVNSNIVQVRVRFRWH